jgi:glycosyltransferase involved in cell wall biosynthesis
MVHVDCDLFKPYAIKNLRSKLGIEDNCCVIGWVGRIDKDLDSIAVFETLELCNVLNTKYPDFCFRFLVIGDGNNKVNLIDKVKRLNLTEKTIVLPSKSQEDLVDYYNIIDFEVLLDEDPQGGSHLREAMACGRVALSVDGLSGAQARLIENKQTGILVKPENRIEEAAISIVSLSGEQRRRIGERAVYFVKRHSYECKAKLIYKRIVCDLV